MVPQKGSFHPQMFVLPGAWRRITEQSPLPMAALEGPQHIIRYTNTSFCRLVGQKEQELIGFLIKDAVLRAKESMAVLDRVYHTGIAELISEQEQPGPNPIYWSYAVWAVFGVHKTPVGLVIQVTDTTEAALFHQQVTAINQELLIGSVRQHELTESAEGTNVKLQREMAEKNRMAEELRLSRDGLEARVKERTAELEDSERRLRVLASELINAQETERKRIAHELHDSLAAQLSGIKYRLERKLKEGKASENLASLQEIIQDVQDANIETRRIMANLRPSILDDLGILPAFSWFCRETEKTYPETLMEFSGSVQEQEIPDELKIVLFRVAQEAVTNAIRHGKSTLIRIGLGTDNGWLRLTVEDNGAGFEALRCAQQPQGHGIGLNSMQQRVDSTGGVFSLSSSPGKGTVVQAEWRRP